jgi:hypothetical protein
MKTINPKTGKLVLHFIIAITGLALMLSDYHLPSLIGAFINGFYIGNGIINLLKK